MSAKIQVASLKAAGRSGSHIVWEEIEIDFLALADAMLGREPRLRQAVRRRVRAERTRPNPFVPRN